MSDLIEPQFITEPDVYIQFNNITRARIMGAEAGIRTFLFELVGMESSLTVMDPKDLESDNTLKYRSKILWYNTLYMPIGNFEISADYRYKSKVQNIDTELAIQISDTDARVPAHIVDLRLKYDMEKDFSLPVNINLIINNLFDYYYTEMVGNLGLTRRITLQLEGTL